MSWYEQSTELIRNTESLVRDLERRAAIAQWNIEVTGQEEFIGQYEELSLKISRLYADETLFSAAKTLMDGAPDETSDLKRELEILYRRCLRKQMPMNIIEDMTRRGIQLEASYNTFRAKIGGELVADNDVETCLLNSSSTPEVEEAYRASKQIAVYKGTDGKNAPVHEQIREIVEVRNSGAREIGYDNFYTMSVELGELGEDWLFQTLDELAAASEGPFRDYKANLDGKLAAQFGCVGSDLMPWHYGGRFFQLPPKAGEIDLDPIFKGKDIVELTVKTFDRMGMDIRPIVDKSDLFPGDPKTSRKSQHAFCTAPDAPVDVRILCNVIDNDRWMMVMLHEFGHGVDASGLSGELPYFIRGNAHTLTTEAIALMMERHRFKSKWLQETAGVEPEHADAIEREAAQIMAVRHLVFTRWVLVMCHFERALYDRPNDPDLDAYWWDIVEKYQLLRRPDKVARPDWASKIHLAGAPAYYQNYLLGEVFGAQLEDYIDENLGGVALNPAAGKFLNEKMFANGARWHWRELLQRLTGSDMKLEPFIKKLTP